MTTTSIQIRTYKPLDEDFIYHSWLSSIRCDFRPAEGLTRALIDGIIPDVGSKQTLYVACEPDEENHILGWAAAGPISEFPLVLHFVFVKRSFRRAGVATALVDTIFGDTRPGKIPCSYWTFQAQQYSLKDKWGLKYNAFLLPAALNERFCLQQRDSGRSSVQVQPGQQGEDPQKEED